jgi:hypothetical protein
LIDHEALEVTQRVQARILGLTVNGDDARADLGWVPVQGDGGSMGERLAVMAGEDEAAEACPAGEEPVADRVHEHRQDQNRAPACGRRGEDASLQRRTAGGQINLTATALRQALFDYWSFRRI